MGIKTWIHATKAHAALLQKMVRKKARLMAGSMALKTAANTPIYNAIQKLEQTSKEIQ